MDKRHVFFSLLILIISSVLVFLSGCSSGSSVDEIDFLVPVTVTDVGTADVEDKITATGTLRATKIARLEVETGGFLEFLTNKSGSRYKEGDRVKAGDVIARITGEDVRLAARTEANYQRFLKAKD